jgi:UDP-N-acetylglucosamine diphosphorylase / glucose-1-phosphate thymidylyltransferase / UDP-N-acetylgalactosamine diphosphorylase / glucosamine-1-phosphate N-acetyltransferase / galactosamine-1-phosphate N-acetyltransferase
MGLSPPRRASQPRRSQLGANLDCVLLCAGRGTRLRPFTDRYPKVLVPIGSVPLLDLILRRIARLGVRRVLLVVGYRQSQVRRHVGSGSRFGLRVVYRVQRKLNGTGAALKVAGPWVRSQWFLAAYGDVWAPFHVWKRLASQAGPSILAARVSDASQFGRLQVSRARGKPRLIGVFEKDGMHTPGLVNAGLYRLPRGIFPFVNELGASSRGEVEFPAALVRYSVTRNPVEVTTTRFWLDIGSPERLQEAARLERRTDR